MKDHPRIRGEHRGARKNSHRGLGSSPHSRGTLHSVTIPTLIPGIIPAFAGNTVPWTEKQLEYKDHPRIRGEHILSVWTLQTGEGSSPHSRGTLPDGAFKRLEDRIIPAFAGNTVTGNESGRYCRDHPRIRGEHLRELKA